MATLKKIGKIDYFENVDFKQIVSYSGNPNPKCDECLKNILFINDLILIPILNEVYCKKCGTEKLKQMQNWRHYRTDDEVQKRRTTFWNNYLIKGKISNY